MREEDTELYTSVSAYLNAPDGMKNEVDMWAVAGGLLVRECVKKETNSEYGGLHNKKGSSIRKCIKKTSFLDLCCGPGNFANYLSLYHPNMQVTGVDSNQRFISYAQRRYSNWTFIESDVFEIDLDQRFDFVTASSAYHHISDDSKADFLKVARRYLKPDGKILMCDHFLPTYETESEREQSVNQYYDALIEYYADGNATTDAKNAISEVRQLELSKVCEQKVDFNRFKSHLFEAGLKIDDRKIVWQPTEFRADEAGSQVLLMSAK